MAKPTFDHLAHLAPVPTMSNDTAGIEPLVSVVIPAYRAAHTIVRAITSVWSQSYRNVEVIVIDDASPDDMAASLALVADPRLAVIRLGTNAGVAGARNCGLARATGTYIAFLDADDEWHPGKLRAQIDALEADEACVLVTCDSEIVASPQDNYRMFARCAPTTGTDAWKTLLIRNFMPTPTVVVRRTAAQAAGAFDETLTYGEDLDYWLRVAVLGSVAVVHQVLVRIHAEPDGVTATQPNGDALVVLPMIQRHVEQWAPRLTAREARGILGTRHFSVGYTALRRGAAPLARSMFCRALLLGHRPLRSSFYLLLSSLRATTGSVSQ